MPTMTVDERSCFERLLVWEQRIERLLALYDRARLFPSMPAQHVDHARDVYRNLRLELGREERRLRTGQRTAAENRWYVRIVLDANTALTAAARQPPDKWYPALAGAESEVGMALSEMRFYFGLAD